MEKTNVNIRYFLFQGDSDSQWRLKTRRWQCCSKSMLDVVKEEEKKKSAGVVWTRACVCFYSCMQKCWVPADYFGCSSGHHRFRQTWSPPTSSWSTAHRWCPGMLARKWRTTSATGRNSPPGGSCGFIWPRLRRFETLFCLVLLLVLIQTHTQFISILSKSYKVQLSTFTDSSRVSCSKIRTVEGAPSCPL